jgi:hypothetical protein
VFRSRIRKFLGLPDTDPLVRGTDPDSDPYGILPSSSNVRYLQKVGNKLKKPRKKINIFGLLLEGH